MSSVTSSAAIILSTEHTRQRRAERLIQKRDCQAALKYGTRVPSYNPRGELCWKYTYADIVYIVSGDLSREVTCWAVPGAGLDVPKREISQADKCAHDAACAKILMDAASWTSHTVIVVDQSGSMRKTDVDGGASRSDAVWLTLAVDFVAKHLETQQSTCTDVVSVVAMCAEGTVLVDRQPPRLVAVQLHC